MSLHLKLTPRTSRFAAGSLALVAMVCWICVAASCVQAQADIRELGKAKSPGLVAKPQPFLMVRPQTETEREAYNALDDELELGEVDVAVGELDRYLQEQFDGVGVFLDPRGLQAASVDPATRIQVTLPEMHLRAALRKMLRPLALKVAVEDEGLVITADYAELARRGIATDRWSGASDRDAAIAETLDQVVSFSFVEVPLFEAIREISEAKDIPLVINSRALEEIGLSAEEPVSLSLKNVSLRSFMRLMLRGLDLTYQIKDEVMQITTIEAAEQNLINRIYFLEGLGERGDEADHVRKLVMATVVPDTWDALGGPSGITSFAVNDRPAIVVSTTSDVHDQIQALLRSLRKAGTTVGPKVDGPQKGRRR